MDNTGLVTVAADVTVIEVSDFVYNNYVISGLTISQESYYNVALFSYAESANFSNITLEVDVTGYEEVRVNRKCY